MTCQHITSEMVLAAINAARQSGDNHGRRFDIEEAAILPFQIEILKASGNCYAAVPSLNELLPPSRIYWVIACPTPLGDWQGDRGIIYPREFELWGVYNRPAYMREEHARHLVASLEMGRERCEMNTLPTITSAAAQRPASIDAFRKTQPLKLSID